MLDFSSLYHRIQHQWTRSLRRIIFWRSPIAQLMRQPFPPSLWQFTQSYLAASENLQAYIRRLIQDPTQQSNFDNYIYAAQFLNGSACFHPEIIQRLAEHARPNDLVFPLSILKSAEILHPDNFYAVMLHPDIQVLSRLIHNVNEAGKLTQENFAILSRYTNPSKLVLPIYLLFAARILSQENFRFLTSSQGEQLLTVDAFLYFWNRINDRHLSAEVFLRLMAASQSQDPRTAFQLLIEQILQPRPPQFELNPAQSTHLSSVHRSVSLSVQKLMALYELDLDLETTLRKLISMTAELAPSLKNNSAQRCIHRLLAPDYILTDAVSGVSLRQLLGLIYVAIHDDSKRLSTLEEAKLALIDGLYEIQRGYNLDKHGSDNGEEDHPICIAGAFNKMIEKLYGLHSAVDINYISQAYACAKFPKIAEKEALIYLNTQTQPSTLEALSTIRRLIDQLKQDRSLEPIWALIKPSVQTQFWQEFHEAYDDDPSHPKLHQLLDNGIFLPIPPLTAIEEKLQTIDFSLSLHPSLLWSNRHQTAAAQQAFDQQFGLIVMNK